MSIWVWSTTQESWDVILHYHVWAVDTETKTKRVKPDDYILFYVKGTGMFRGIFQISGTWYKSKKLIWPDEVASKNKKYHYECKLKPYLIKDAIFNEVKDKLDFLTQYTKPVIALRGGSIGPANFGKPISPKDLDTISSYMKKIIKPKQIAADSDHEEIIECLSKIGDALGFDTFTEQEYTLVSQGAIVDMVWETKFGHLGTIRYTFEVQSKGSIKSLINNLILSMNNPNVKKVIAVSDEKQLEKIRNLVQNTDAYTNTAKSMFVFLPVNTVQDLAQLLPKLTKFKKILAV